MMPRLSRSQRKQFVRDALTRRDLDGLVAAGVTDRRVANDLLPLVAGPDALLRWRAIEALGRLAEALAPTQLEWVRDTTRRLFWMMNEESGANVRQAPEAIGQLLASVPALAPEYLSMLADSLDEPFFREGVAWALSRVAATAPAQVAPCQPELLEALEDDSPAVRCWAFCGLSATGAMLFPSDRSRFLADDSRVTTYDFKQGVEVTTTVGQIVANCTSDSA